MKSVDITKAVKKVTKKYTAQRKREERDSRARFHREEYMYSDRVNQTDVAWEVIPEAYAKASNNGKLPAHARQIFYAARKEIQDCTGRTLNSQYFTQNLLPKYINTHPEAQSWWVVYDARGRLSEPHTNTTIPLGTLEVDNYLREIRQHRVGSFQWSSSFDSKYPTKGTDHRISAVLFIEKEGFNELFKEVKLAERYDIAIMSSKGQSNVATRQIVDELCRVDAGVPVLILHDFDKSGLEISQNLTSVSAAAYDADRVRYEFCNEINFIDLGIRLADVEECNLEPESVRFKGNFGPDSIATSEEEEFLRGNQRVELNAFTSADFIAWIESKLEEYGIRKMVPDDETLERAFRRAYQIAAINADVTKISAQAADQAADADLPDGLRDRIQTRLDEDPALPWDKVVAQIAEERFFGGDE